MSIVIDSLRPNEFCGERTGLNDRCRIDATFHTVLTESGSPHPRVTRMEPQDILRFRRELQGNQLRFVLDQPVLSSIFRGLAITHHFSPELDPGLQAAFNYSVILTPFLRGFFDQYRQRLNITGPEFPPLFEDFVNHLMVGEIVRPDPLQDENNFGLYSRILSSSPPIFRAFREFLVGLLLGGNRSRLSPAMGERLDRLQNILNFGHRVNQALNSVASNGPLFARVREAEGTLIRYLYRAEGSYDSIARTLRPLAMDLYRQSGRPPLNLYQILRAALNNLQDTPPFRGTGAARDRFQTLTRLLELPGPTQDLELSQLEPITALERSVAQGLAASPSSFSTSDLRTAVHAVFSALRFQNAGGTSVNLSVDPEQFRNLRFQIDSALRGSERDRSRLARVFSHVLYFIFGEAGRGIPLRGFWNGQLRDLNLTLDERSRNSLRSVQSWLEALQPSTPRPERFALPISEGALCAAGGGLLVWGALAPPARGIWNAPLIAGGGLSGLGCGALATHFIIPSRNRWAADLIGGGVGAGVGMGLTILIQLLGGQLNLPPLEGRNPTTGRGP